MKLIIFSVLLGFSASCFAGEGHCDYSKKEVKTKSSKKKVSKVNNGKSEKNRIVSAQSNRNRASDKY